MDIKRPNSIIIKGTGKYVPEKIVTNDDLSKIVDTSDEWIFGRSGIKRRRIAAAGETTSDMALMHGIPSLKMGPGESSRSHTADEFILLEELNEALHLYPALISGIDVRGLRLILQEV